MKTSPSLSRREFSRHLAAGVAGAWLPSALGSSAAQAAITEQPSSQPNIVFVLSDQHACGYCGFMGHPFVRTPNLDRIAARGAVFRNTYCGNPVCAPSRSGMICGAYGSDVNSFCNATVWDGSLPAWPALLRDAGYITFGTGKMDTSDEHDLGFTQNAGLRNQHQRDPDVTAFFRRPLCGRVNERHQVDGRTRAQPHQGDTQVTARSIDFIHAQPKGGAPWLVYCGGSLPHPPFTARKEDFESYLARVDLPHIPAGHLEELHFVFQQLRHFKNIATPIPEARLLRARAAYCAMITELDENAGRIWRALEETGQLDNTIFVYSSDHGESLGEHGLWLKNNLYENAVRVPMVMAGPGIPRGATIDTPVAHADLVRAFLEWSGAKTHDKLRGHSLVPLTRGEKGDHPGWAFSESHSEGNCTGSFMIRKGDWKYIHFTWHDARLFNLAEDPGEFENRIDDPPAQGALEELRAILHAEVDPVEVTERAFATQQKRMDRFARDRTPEEMLDSLRGRLGEGQSVALLNAYYGHTFPYTSKSSDAGSASY
ncbi:MAG: sulfatase-like hydrolase/transferase [Opitutaceae bacterium]